MDNSQSETYPQYVRTIRRSKRKYPIAVQFYLRMVWLFSASFLMESAIFLFSESFHFCISLCFWFCIVSLLLGKRKFGGGCLCRL